MRYIKNNVFAFAFIVVMLVGVACEQEGFDPVLTTEDGAGTLTEYMAYELDTLAGDSLYGRVVFWRGLDGATLVQLSLYKVGDEVMPSSIISGAFGVGSTPVMELYDVTNTGEGYGFGEFSTSKYFRIDDLSFYDEIPSLDAHVVVYASDLDATIRTQGNIGANADPVESN